MDAPDGKQLDDIKPEYISLRRWKHGLGKRQRQYLAKFWDQEMHEAYWPDQEFFLEYPQLADYLDALHLPLV